MKNIINVLLKILTIIFVYKNPDGKVSIQGTIERNVLYLVIFFFIFVVFLCINKRDYMKIVNTLIILFIFILLLMANYAEERRKKKVKDDLDKIINF